LEVNGNIKAVSLNTSVDLKVGENTLISSKKIEFKNSTGTYGTVGIYNTVADEITIKSAEVKIEGDTNIGSSALFVKGNNGNVGIGTTTPTAKLEINGNVKVKTLDVSSFFYLSKPLSFGDSGSTIGGKVINFVPDNFAEGASNGYLRINFYDDDNVMIGTDYDGHSSTGHYRNIHFGKVNESHLVIKNTGNVGIGTTSPKGKLEVAGTITQGSLVARPLVTWSASGNTTGAVVIALPGTIKNYGMVHMEVDVYEYDSTNATTYIIGGHNWNGRWYRYGANTIGTSGKKLRLGVKDGQYVIILGEPGSTWSYGHVVLSKITTGGYYSGVMNLGGAYKITQTNATETYS
jgi:hypothetical protein